MSLISLVPRPLPRKVEKRVWCSERHFLSLGVGLNSVKNVIIAFPVHVYRTAGILDLMLDDVLQSESSSLIGEL